MKSSQLFLNFLKLLAILGHLSKITTMGDQAGSLPSLGVGMILIISYYIYKMIKVSPPFITI